VTKFKTYKCGPYTFKSYMKPVGHGYEIGFMYKGRTYFMSNFIHKTEATTWWTKFNKEIMSFSKKFYMANKMPFTWYCNFLGNHLYTCYYNWLETVFTKHETNFKRAFSKDIRKYRTLKKHMNPKTTHPWTFRAA
jgi:hypothetical protein